MNQLSLNEVNSIKPILSWGKSVKTKKDLDRLGVYNPDTDSFLVTNNVGGQEVVYRYFRLDDIYYCCLDEGDLTISKVMAPYEKDNRLASEFYLNSLVTQDNVPVTVDQSIDSDPLNYLNNQVYFLTNGMIKTIPNVDEQLEDKYEDTEEQQEYNYLPECFQVDTRLLDKKYIDNLIKSDGTPITIGSKRDSDPLHNVNNFMYYLIGVSDGTLNPDVIYLPDKRLYKEVYARNRIFKDRVPMTVGSKMDSDPKHDINQFVYHLVDAYATDKRLTEERYIQSRILSNKTPITIDSNMDSDPLNYINDQVYWNVPAPEYPKEDPRLAEDRYIDSRICQDEVPVTVGDERDSDIYRFLNSYMYWHVPEAEKEDEGTDITEILEANIFYVKDDKLVKAFSALDCRLLDVHYQSPIPVNKTVVNDYIEHIGLDNPFNNRVINNRLLTKYINEFGDLSLIYGNSEELDACKIHSDDEYLTITRLGQLDDFMYKLNGSDHIHLNIQLGMMGGHTYEDLVEAYDELNSILTRAERNPVFDIEPSDVIEICKYGEIADYISLSTQVDAKYSESSMVRYSRSKITENRIPIEEHISEILNASNPYLFRIIDKNYVVNRLINSNDLLEITILFKVNNELKSRMLWYGESINYYSGDSSDDPLVYFNWILDTFNKLNWYGEHIRFDGYHISHGDILEGAYTVYCSVGDSLMKIGEDFVLDISKDSLNIFPTNENINEYYIKSCKRLVKS